jgi:hypothetical protein
MVWWSYLYLLHKVAHYISWEDTRTISNKGNILKSEYMKPRITGHNLSLRMPQLIEHSTFDLLCQLQHGAIWGGHALDFPGVDMVGML